MNQQHLHVLQTMLIKTGSEIFLQMMLIQNSSGTAFPA